MWIPWAVGVRLLLDARDKPDVKREPLGEKDIDGRHVIGFRITTPAAVIECVGRSENRHAGPHRNDRGDDAQYESHT